MSLRIVNTAITTVGAGVLSAAALIGQLINRSGPTGAFADTTDTAVNIIGAMRGLGNTGSAADPITWIVKYVNTTAYTATLAAGVGVTLTSNVGTGLSVVAGAVATLLVSAAPAAGLVTVTVLYRSATE